jgi:DNA invertase Pin-like site-specific DNA recombinase
MTALRDAGAGPIFVDPASGPRLELGRCLEHLSAGDTLLVVGASSLASSLDGFITIAALLRSRDVRLRSLTEPALSSAPLTDEVLSAIDDLRHQLFSIRTREGMDAARAAGRKPGRPRVMSLERIAVARELRAQKRSFAQIGRSLGVSEAAVRRALKPAVDEGQTQSTAP